MLDLDLPRIESICKADDPNSTYIINTHARTWLPVLIQELRQAREELAAVDESLGEFYAPVLEPETDEPCGSFWKDHGVGVIRQELERARAEVKRLRAEVRELQEYGETLVDALHEEEAEHLQVERDMLAALIPLYLMTTSDDRT